MEAPGCPRRRRPIRLLGWMLGALTAVGFGEPLAVQARWQVSYPPAPQGAAAESTAVPLNGGSLLVAVVKPGADARRPTVRLGNREVPVKVIGYDRVSSLTFLEAGSGAVPGEMPWLADANGVLGLPLRAMSPGGPVTCRANGWIKQVGTKILPLALLQVTFDQAVPPSGTPILDPQGRVAAVLFQASGQGRTGYAIPAEAVHRVRRDLSDGGSLVRGWLGLSLRAEIQSPKIVQVLQDSPAAAAGIQPADVLLHVGTRRIADYADAVNAFFYLIPGQPVRVKLQRGNRQFESTLTPTRPPAR